jgi:hypothetical protein
MVKLNGAARVSIAEMMQTNGNLDQALIELSRRALVLGPEFLPNFVSFEEVALVEVLDAFEVPRIVLLGRRIHKLAIPRLGHAGHGGGWK